jgi:hypothetical protein
MHAVIRSYSGHKAGALFDLLNERKSEVEELMRPIPGFVSYALVRTADGGASITVCDDEAGTDESIARARDWIGQNASELHTEAPAIAEGPVILHVD